MIFLYLFCSIYRIDFRDIDKNSYVVENEVLDETIGLSLRFPENKGISNQIIYKDGRNIILLQKIIESKGQYEVIIDFIGAGDRESYTVISPYIFSEEENIMKEDIDIVVVYEIDNSLRVRELTAYSFQKTHHGIRTSYKLLYSTEEIEMLKNSSFEISLVFNKLIKQTWRKNV